MKKLGLVIVLLCLSMAVSAGGFMFKHLEVKDGLSSNRVNDIFKDSEGFMWFATASGLVLASIRFVLCATGEGAVFL